MSMTYDELLAMGLSEDEARAIAVNTESVGTGGGLPFPQLKINYDSDAGVAGSFVFDVKKDKEGTIDSVGACLESVEFIPVAFKCQYSKFDSTTNKSAVSSTIVSTRDAKQAIDLKSGLPIAKLKESDDKIKYSKVMVGLLKNGTEYSPFLMYISGAALYAFNEAVPEDAAVRNKVKIGGTVKGKKGSVTFYTPKDIEVVGLTDKEVMTNIKKVAEVSKKFNDWVAQVNGAGSAPRAAAGAKAPSVSTDSDDVVWED